MQFTGMPNRLPRYRESRTPTRMPRCVFRRFDVELYPEDFRDRARRLDRIRPTRLLAVSPPARGSTLATQHHRRVTRLRRHRIEQTPQLLVTRPARRAHLRDRRRRTLGEYHLGDRVQREITHAPREISLQRLQQYR